jgi:hypothetical protein
LVPELDQLTLLENFDKLLLVIYELVDEGIFFENDPDTLAGKIESKTNSTTVDIDEGITSVIKNAKDTVTKSSFFRNFF